MICADCKQDWQGHDKLVDEKVVIAKDAGAYEPEEVVHWNVC